jgi:hypothetical protein
MKEDPETGGGDPSEKCLLKKMGPKVVYVIGKINCCYVCRRTEELAAGTLL